MSECKWAPREGTTTNSPNVWREAVNEETIGPIMAHLGRLKPEWGHAPKDVVEKTITGDFQLWSVNNLEGIVFTEIRLLPQHKELNMAFGLGNLLPFHKEIDAVLTEFGRVNYCKYITEVGRKGWMRLGKPLGYRDRFTMMAKEI